MKIRLFAILILALLFNQQAGAQYKDLEGVFFGKVIAVGAGGSVHAYKNPLGTETSVTALTYSVILNNKKFTSMRFAVHPKFRASYEGNDGFSDYTRTNEYKFVEVEFGYKVALTGEGFDKPTSLFLHLMGGSLIGKTKTIDSRYGESEEGDGHSYIGGGLSLFQRMGSRVIFFAEPFYKFSVSRKIWLDDNGEQKFGFSNLGGNLGVMFLIGKSN